MDDYKLDVNIKTLIAPFLKKTLDAKVVIVEDRWDVNAWRECCILYRNGYDYSWISIDSNNSINKRPSGEKEDLLFNVIKENFIIFIFDDKESYMKWFLKRLNIKLETGKYPDLNKDFVNGKNG